VNRVREAETCVHFRGIQHETCRAGVRLQLVKDTSGDGPFRWPCIPPLPRAQPCTTTCAQRRFPTDEEMAAEERVWTAALNRIDAGRSPCCDAALDVRTAPRDTSRVLFCKACGEVVMRACRPEKP
jgi:hypothetical protein